MFVFSLAHNRQILLNGMAASICTLYMYNVRPLILTLYLLFEALKSPKFGSHFQAQDAVGDRQCRILYGIIQEGTFLAKTYNSLYCRGVCRILGEGFWDAP